MFKYPLGVNRISKNTFYYNFPQNSDQFIRTGLFLSHQGDGKTNLLQSLVYGYKKAFDETKGKCGAIPIVFSILFEWTQINYPSKDDNVSPELEPDGIEAIQYTFQLANPPEEEKKLEIVSIPFCDLTVEDLALFCGLRSNKELGIIAKYVKFLKKEKPDYTIDDFIDYIVEDKGVADALYYVFDKLRGEGFFNQDYLKFDWYNAIKQRKPIVFNLGEIDNVNLLQGIAGYLLRTLFDLATIYYNAKRKYYTTGRKKSSLTEKERFLVENFNVALIFEEAHSFFMPNPSRMLLSSPATDYFRRITSQLGRKRGFKYSWLVTTNVMFIYDQLRKTDELIFGSRITADDWIFMDKELQIPRKIIEKISKNPKFGFCIMDPDRVRRLQTPCISLIRSYRSPCGMLE